MFAINPGHTHHRTDATTPNCRGFPSSIDRDRSGSSFGHQRTSFDKFIEVVEGPAIDGSCANPGLRHIISGRDTFRNLRIAAARARASSVLTRPQDRVYLAGPINCGESTKRTNDAIFLPRPASRYYKQSATSTAQLSDMLICGACH